MPKKHINSVDKFVKGMTSNSIFGIVDKYGKPKVHLPKKMEHLNTNEI